MSSMAFLAFRRSSAPSFASATARSFSISRVALDPAVAAKKATKISEADGTKRIAKKESTKSTGTEKKTKEISVKKEVKKAKPEAIKITAADKPPKKPAGAWTRFLTKFVESNKLSDSPVSISEYAKNASSVWSSMSADEKAPYEEAYKKEWQEYLVKFQEYSRTVDPSIIKEINARRQRKGLKRIRLSVGERRPANAFIRFTNARRETLGGASSGIKESAQFARESGVAWRALSDTEKLVYREAADKDLKEWQERQKSNETEAST